MILLKDGMSTPLPSPLHTKCYSCIRVRSLQNETRVEAEATEVAGEVVKATLAPPALMVDEATAEPKAVMVMAGEQGATLPK